MCAAPFTSFCGLQGEQRLEIALVNFEEFIGHCSAEFRHH